MNHSMDAGQSGVGVLTVSAKWLVLPFLLPRTLHSLLSSLASVYRVTTMWQMLSLPTTGDGEVGQQLLCCLTYARWKMPCVN